MSNLSKNCGNDKKVVAVSFSLLCLRHCASEPKDRKGCRHWMYLCWFPVSNTFTQGNKYVHATSPTLCPKVCENKRAEVQTAATALLWHDDRRPRALFQRLRLRRRRLPRGDHRIMRRLAASRIRIRILQIKIDPIDAVELLPVLIRLLRQRRRRLVVPGGRILLSDNNHNFLQQQPNEVPWGP